MNPLPLSNVQPSEKPDRHPDGQLDVHSIFYTLQGEGPFAGRPAVFVRLAGCNLQCPACDTEYTRGRYKDGPDSLVHKVRDTAPPLFRRPLVVLTGGEPFRQNPGPFVRRLMEDGYEVQVETNGTLNPYDWPYGVRGQGIVCSPKTPRIALDLPEHVAAWKYVLQAGKVASDGLPTSSLGMEGVPARPLSWHVDEGKVWVQPLDEKDPDKNRENLKAAVASCLRFGYRLSVQMHKEADLP